MSKKRLLIAVLVGALVAVGAAVPVIAQIIGKPAQSGYVRMYQYVNDDDTTSWEATGTSTVRLTFDAKADPYSISMLAVGTRLQPRTEYALVNITGYGRDEATDPDEYWVDVDVLGTARSGKLGTLSLKAFSGEPLSDSWDEVEDEDFMGIWARFSGADVWLVPVSALETDEVNYPGDTWIDVTVDESGTPEPNCAFVYASLGLPTDWDDVFSPYLWED